jgi:hypothetical protein
LAEALIQGVTKIFNVKSIPPSVQNPEKVQVEIDGFALPEEFDTENEAMTSYARFYLGLLSRRRNQKHG